MIMNKECILKNSQIIVKTASIRMALLLFLLSFMTSMSAKDHALMVQRLSYWAPDYLTITNNWNNLYFTQTVSTLKTLSVITEINGESTKGISIDVAADKIRGEK